MKIRTCEYCGYDQSLNCCKARQDIAAKDAELARLRKVAEATAEYERLETERVTGIRASEVDIVSLTRDSKERMFEAVREWRGKR